MTERGRTLIIAFAVSMIMWAGIIAAAVSALSISGEWGR